MNDNPFYEPVPDGAKKTSTVPAEVAIWGELYIDAAGGSNFRFHVEHGDFTTAKKALEKFVVAIQQRLEYAPRCPFYEEEIKATREAERRSAKASPVSTDKE